MLLGPPGAGKSTVGPLVASALGRPFVDLDTEIERRTGRTVAEIFDGEGERGFRAHERAVTAELFRNGAPLIVLAPGGGWVEDRANQSQLGTRATAVYLRVTPAIALARMGETRSSRPLLQGTDPLKILEVLMSRREPLYLQAEHTVSVDLMSPAEVAASIVALATSR